MLKKKEERRDDIVASKGMTTDAVKEAEKAKTEVADAEEAVNKAMERKKKAQDRAASSARKAAAALKYGQDLKKGASVAAMSALRAMDDISNEMRSALLVDEMPVGLAARALQITAKYEALLMQIMLENERLRGRLDERLAASVGGGGGMQRNEVKGAIAATVVDGVVKVGPAAVVGGAGAPIAGKVRSAGPPLVAAAEETWALVVEKMAGSTNNDDTAKNVLKEVVPSLGRCPGAHTVSCRASEASH